MSGGWEDVEAALDAVAADGRRLAVWLRDDDAVTVTPALEHLARLCAQGSMPLLLAVIPAGATQALADFVAAHPSITPCQHGYAHINHAPAGARACELGGARSLDAIEHDLRRGRETLRRLFGPRLADCLVPPWNRIDPDVVPRLPALGFDRLSVFGPPGEPDGLRRLNADLDIVDWRNGRVGRSLADVSGKLAALVPVAHRHRRPIGLLTHHLAHDETAWSVLDTLLKRLRRHPAVTFSDVAALG